MVSSRRWDQYKEVVTRTVALTSLLLLLTAGVPLRLQTAAAPAPRVAAWTGIPFVQISGTDWRAFSDAVVRVRIDSLVSFETPGLESYARRGAPHISTAFRLAGVSRTRKCVARSIPSSIFRRRLSPGLSSHLCTRLNPCGTEVRC